MAAISQVEIHRTDSHALQPDQWRLAIGFKVLSTAPPTARPSSCLPACGCSARRPLPHRCFSNGQSIELR
jgi:hypothetical protein